MRICGTVGEAETLFADETDEAVRSNTFALQSARANLCADKAVQLRDASRMHCFL